MSAVHDFHTGEEIDPIEAAYRRVRAEYDQAKRDAESFGGPCETCRHFSKGGHHMFYEHRCSNPLAVTFKFDRNKGEVVAVPYGMDNWMRPRGGAPEVCGANRRLWEARLSWWQRLLEWFAA